MPTSGDSVLLVDTSVAVAFLVTGHEAHGATFGALRNRSMGLAGHAAFETYSVLTRLPEPARTSPAAALAVIESNFPHTVQPTARRVRTLLTEFSRHGISGGSTYDALVAAAAVEHGLQLASRDRRAARTYQLLGVDLQLLD